MSQKYFGDLAVITDDTAWVATFLAIFGGTVLIAKARSLTRSTFFYSALGYRGVSAREQLPLLAFTLALIAFSTQAMGLLFTISALFVPTTLLARAAGGYKTHLIACGGVGLLASVGGFVLSLAGPELPTVPVVCFSMVGLSALATVILRFTR
jgi:ABC-type Mn2+/Zn2+ transport system permease subunit